MIHLFCGVALMVASVLGWGGTPVPLDVPEERLLCYAVVDEPGRDWCEPLRLEVP